MDANHLTKQLLVVSLQLHLGVDNFLEVGGLKTVSAKFLHYHAYFCITTPRFYNVCPKIWEGPPYLHPWATYVTEYCAVNSHALYRASQQTAV